MADSSTMTVSRRMLLRAAGWLGALLRLGASEGPAPILFWPRLTDPAEAAEQFWRANYFWTGHAVTLWVDGEAGRVVSRRPEHVGPVAIATPPVRLVRGRFAVLWVLLTTVRRRGVLLCWQRGASGPGGSFRRKLFRAMMRVETFDRHENPDEGTRQAIVVTTLSGLAADPDRDRSRFLEYMDSLPRYKRCYVFGTGPSLGLAEQMDFSDGYRVICNTIVKDRQLLERIKPHFVVAGDGVYHFGYTRYAYAFRQDLMALLAAQPIRFVYPQVYDTLVRRELRAFEGQLIGIPPQAAVSQSTNLDLRSTFALPPGGNVLTALLLPLAATLADEVFLLGFDGRAPSDKLFWTYSTRHHYDELFPDLRAANPSFFTQRDMGQYFQNVFRDEVETVFQTGEGQGKSFIPLVPSYSPALAKRYRAECVAERPAAERDVLEGWAARVAEAGKECATASERGNQ